MDNVMDLYQVISKQNLIIELNTSGLRKRTRETYPSPKLIKEARIQEMRICFGSDAHKPEEVGSAWEHAISVIAQSESQVSLLKKNKLWIDRSV